jgi:integrase
MKPGANDVKLTILITGDELRMLRRVSHSRVPARARAMILLSVKAGLRACEIAGLDWSMVLDVQGRVSGTIHVRDVIAKKRGGRRIPMHPDLRRALERLARTTEPTGPVIRSYRGAHLKPNSIVNWFVALFEEPSYEGCSSHSGRRSFITGAARNIHRSGCSLRDVQLLAGHRSIENRNDRTLHRRRHLRPEAIGRVRLGTGQGVSRKFAARRNAQGSFSNPVASSLPEHGYSSDVLDAQPAPITPGAKT